MRVCEFCITLPARVSTYDKVLSSNVVLALLYIAFLILESINLQTKAIKGGRQALFPLTNRLCSSKGVRF